MPKPFSRLFRVTSSIYPILKFVSDIFLSFLLLLFVSPLFAAISFAIFLSDFRSPFYCSRRIGQFGIPFTLFKFRTMPVGTPLVVSTSPLVKTTRMGSFLRRLSLDELPQLINVLLGQMSLVGPRPCLVSQTELISSRSSNHSLSLRPGLTGWAQVNSYSGMGESVKADLDGDYYLLRSFPFDLYILLFRTPCYLLSPPPVY